MKRALILYWHGLGDVIMLTPHLRHLHEKGYWVDLMCRKEVLQSKLLDNCPYVNTFFVVENPWRAKAGFTKTALDNVARFIAMRAEYDWSGMSPHEVKKYRGLHKIRMTSAELGIERLRSSKLEVFIPPGAEEEAWRLEPGSYNFVHTRIEFHKDHSWDASDWMKKNLPPLRTVSVWDKRDFKFGINTAFVIARRAKHRVLSSSVFVHACEAMGCTISVINYGNPDRKVWPLDQTKVLRIRENGKWVK